MNKIEKNDIKLWENKPMESESPIDMSINSATCPFKKTVSLTHKVIDAKENSENDSNQNEMDLNTSINISSLNNISANQSNNMSTLSNSAFPNNSQTCMDFLKVAFNQILASKITSSNLCNPFQNISSLMSNSNNATKTLNNVTNVIPYSNVAFAAAAAAALNSGNLQQQSQFQVPSNIIPLLLPALATNPFLSVNNSNEQSHLINDHHLNSNKLSNNNNSENPTSIESLLFNIQQSKTGNGFDSKTINKTFSNSTFSGNINTTANGSSNNIFIDSKNDLTVNSFNYKRHNERVFNSNNTTKRINKKIQSPSQQLNKNQSNLNRNIGNHSLKIEPSLYLNNSDSNLYNRSFLENHETLNQNSGEFDLSNNDTCHENNESPANQSSHNGSMSPPSVIANNNNSMSLEKPHRQNFTGDQNRILSEWFYNHSDKPYPSTDDTKKLSLKTGLTYSQVKKWFANKRARSSTNKKGGNLSVSESLSKGYCMITPAESTVEETASNNELFSPDLSNSIKTHSDIKQQPSDICFPVDFTLINNGNMDTKK